jgi:hypothetical protein
LKHIVSSIEGLWKPVTVIDSQSQFDEFLMRNIGVANQPLIMSRAKDFVKEKKGLEDMCLIRKKLGVMKPKTKIGLIRD